MCEQWVLRMHSKRRGKNSSGKTLAHILASIDLRNSSNSSSNQSLLPVEGTVMWLQGIYPYSPMRSYLARSKWIDELNLRLHLGPLIPMLDKTIPTLRRPTPINRRLRNKHKRRPNNVPASRFGHRETAWRQEATIMARSPCTIPLCQWLRET